MTQSATSSWPESTEALSSGWQLPIISQPISQQITLIQHVYYELLKSLIVKISKGSDYGRMRTATSVKEKKNESYLDEKVTTKPIAYNFGMLFNDGKKIAWLKNGLKICCA